MDSATASHAHEFSPFAWHFRTYGRSDVHMHDCHDSGCDIVLVGYGRQCDRDPATHVRRDLNDESWRHIGTALENEDRDDIVGGGHVGTMAPATGDKNG